MSLNQDRYIMDDKVSIWTIVGEFIACCMCLIGLPLFLLILHELTRDVPY